jgi:hypothetical protein
LKNQIKHGISTDKLDPIVKQVFKKITNDDLDGILQLNEDLQVLQDTRVYLNRIGIDYKSGGLFMNGKFVELDNVSCILHLFF